MKPFLRVENSVARLGDLLQLGNFSKPVVTIILPKSSTLLCNFCKGVKIFHFSSKFILGNFYRHLTTFYWSHWLKMARSREQFLSPSLTSTIGTTFSTLKPIWNVPAKRDQNRWSLKSKQGGMYETYLTFLRSLLYCLNGSKVSKYEEKICQYLIKRNARK